SAPTSRSRRARRRSGGRACSTPRRFAPRRRPPERKTVSRAPQRTLVGTTRREEPEMDIATELDHRAQDGLEVTLLWWRIANRLEVAVLARKAGEGFVVPVGDDSPLEVFHHPY